MTGEKSLERWDFEIRSIGKRHWLTFYSDMLGKPVSSVSRFYRALQLYGYWPMFESIVETSGRGLEDDPLGYVVKVASVKFKEDQQQIQADDEYIKSIKSAQEASRKANDALAKKIARRRKGK